MDDKLQVTEKITKHDVDIKNLFKTMNQMDAKIDKIDSKLTEMTNDLHKHNNSVESRINDLNIELHENTFDIDKRVTALESRIETLKWVFGAVVVIITVLQFFINHLN